MGSANGTQKFLNLSVGSILQLYGLGVPQFTIRDPREIRRDQGTRRYFGFSFCLGYSKLVKHQKAEKFVFLCFPSI